MENCNVNQSGIEQYQAENQAVSEYVLQKYFFDDFKVEAKNEFGKNMEIIVSPRCNLGCKYCYVHRYRKEIFDESVFDEKLTIDHLKLLLKWLEKNEYAPNIEIFSGELLSQEVGYQVLETLYEHFKNTNPILKPKVITIPTNFTFVCSEEATKRVEDIREKLRSIDIELGLSASFDGKYMEENRPYIHDLDIDLDGGVRDDNYYEKCFQYAKETCTGFHPMVYSKNIKNWIKNFDWFQEKMAEYDIPWETIYLLQVRNEEWKQEDVWELQKFIRHLYAFVWEKCGHNPYEMVDFILKGGGFNLLAEPFSSTGRGLTCGIQSQFTVRLSDLMLYPCHRTGYKDFYFGQLVEDDEKILKFKNINAELLSATYFAHKEAFPYCANCAIRHCCVGTCLGAQYEATRNLFVPIPSVCIVMYAIVTTSIECLLKYGAYNYILSQIGEDKTIELERIRKEVFANYDYAD